MSQRTMSIFNIFVNITTVNLFSSYQQFLTLFWWQQNPLKCWQFPLLHRYNVHESVCCLVAIRRSFHFPLCSHDKSSKQLLILEHHNSAVLHLASRINSCYSSIVSRQRQNAAHFVYSRSKMMRSQVEMCTHIISLLLLWGGGGGGGWDMDSRFNAKLLTKIYGTSLLL